MISHHHDAPKLSVTAKVLSRSSTEFALLLKRASPQGVFLDASFGPVAVNFRSTLGSLRPACLIFILANVFATSGQAGPPAIEASKSSTKEMSKEVAAFCSQPSRRKVELHPEQTKSDGTFVMLCGEEALLIKAGKIIHRLPIHITWEGNADKTPVRPAVKHMEFGSRDTVTVQVDSAGDSERSKLCSQIFSVYRNELLAGPGFCRAGDSAVKQITSRDKSSGRELLVTTIEAEDAAPTPSPSPSKGTKGKATSSSGSPKAKLVTNEIWSWHRAEWRMKPNEGASQKPKYGKEAILLSRDHQYMRDAPALDFWSLVPYYVPQKSDSACSIASIAMVVNAILGKQDRTADQELASQSGLIKEMKNDKFRADVIQGGMGVTLDQLKIMLEASLKVSGVSGFSIDVVHADSISNDVRNQLHQHLVANEASDRNFIIANFSQGAFTGDVGTGHIAPVGAFDEKRKRVLILDPDRQWYEPYWVSEETFLKGMATQDHIAAHARGYLFLQLK